MFLTENGKIILHARSLEVRCKAELT